MKKYISLFLLFVISIQSGYAVGVSVWFFMNREKIAEKYCVNKSRPSLQCNGKCYLSKKMKEAAAEDNSVPVPEGIHFVKSGTCIIHESFFQTEVFNEDIVAPPSTGELNNQYEFKLWSEIFHPPGVPTSCL